MIRKHSKMLIAAALCAAVAVAAAGIAACSTSDDHTWDYDNGVWTWAEDNMSATYTVSCLDEGCSATKDFASDGITYVSIGASCTEDGSTEYTVFVTIEDKEYSDTKTVTIPATGHSYKDSWVWAEDYSSATCTLACQNTGCTESKDYTATGSAITTTTTEPTCTEAGTTTYTATITGDDGKTYSNSVTIETTEATGHSWDYTNGEWSWKDDGSSVTFTVSCTNDGCTETKTYTSIGDESQITITTSSSTDATCTEDGSTTYTASLTVGEDTYTSTKTVTTPATGHNYTASWNWSDDASSVTLTLTCSNDGCNNTQTYSSGDEGQITISAGETTEATCTEEGSTTYTAAITVDGTEYTDTKTITTEATGHDYDYTNGTWAWSEDYSSVTFIVTCNNCGDTVEYTSSGDDAQITISTEDQTEATCTTDGSVTYTATVTIDSTDYTDSQTLTLEATGHSYDYENGTWTWDEDYASATLSVECSVCQETDSITAVVTSETTTEATSTTEGTITYTATVTVDGKDYTDTQEVSYSLYSASFSDDFTTDSQDGVWSYGEISYSWSPDDTYTYVDEYGTNGPEGFNFTAATELNDGKDGWVMDNCEIKAGWINVGDMTGIVFTAPQDMTVDVEVSYTGTIENNALSLRVAVVTSDGTTISFIVNSHEGTYSNIINLSEGDMIFFIFTNEAGDVEGAYPQANLTITIKELAESEINDQATDEQENGQD